MTLLTFSAPSLDRTRPSPSRAVRSNFFKRPATIESERDGVSGLVPRSTFVVNTQALLDIAARERREVAVVSVLIEGIDTAGERYSEPDANALLAAAGATWLGSEPVSAAVGQDAVGRIGLAEIGWASLIESRSDMVRCTHRQVDLIGKAMATTTVVPRARIAVGSALSRGRSLDVEELLLEARAARYERSGATNTAS